MFCDEAAEAEKIQNYKDAIAKWEDEPIVKAWPSSAALGAAATKLAETIQELEHRGLLQYDAGSNRYDLHPVVSSARRRISQHSICARHAARSRVGREAQTVANVLKRVAA